MIGFPQPPPVKINWGEEGRATVYHGDITREGGETCRKIEADLERLWVLGRYDTTTKQYKELRYNTWRALCKFNAVPGRISMRDVVPWENRPIKVPGIPPSKRELRITRSPIMKPEDFPLPQPGAKEGFIYRSQIFDFSSGRWPDFTEPVSIEERNMEEDLLEDWERANRDMVIKQRYIDKTPELRAGLYWWKQSSHF